MLNYLSQTVHFGGIVAVVGEGALGDDFAAIEFGIDVMDGDAIDFHAVSDRILHRMCAAKRWEQRQLFVQTKQGLLPRMR